MVRVLGTTGVSEDQSSYSDEGQDSGSNRVARISLLVFLLVILGSGYALWRFQPEIRHFAKAMIESTGGWGVALGFFVVDAFSAPIPNDIFSVFGRMGGMPFWEVVAWASSGSITGGCVGWWIGRHWIARNRWLRAWMRAQGGKSVERVRQQGGWFLAVAAVTPMPYSLVCWGAGIVRLPFGTVLGVSTLRIGRIAFYLWLIEQGVVNIGAE